jgi:hypothetical protein
MVPLVVSLFLSISMVLRLFFGLGCWFVVGFGSVLRLLLVARCLELSSSNILASSVFMDLYVRQPMLSGHLGGGVFGWTLSPHPKHFLVSSLLVGV